MLNSNRWITLMIIVGGVQMTAIHQRLESTSPNNQSSQIEKIDGSELSRITITEKAAARLDIQTADVRIDKVENKSRTIIPYSAVIYDLHGKTWAYISPTPLSFVRHSITIDYIKGNWAILSKGPPVGTKVVSVGVAELFGVEFGIGK